MIPFAEAEERIQLAYSVQKKPAKFYWAHCDYKWLWDQYIIGGVGLDPEDGLRLNERWFLTIEDVATKPFLHIGVRGQRRGEAWEWWQDVAPCLRNHTLWEFFNDPYDPKEKKWIWMFDRIFNGCEERFRNPARCLWPPCADKYNSMDESNTTFTELVFDIPVAGGLRTPVHFEIYGKNLHVYSARLAHRCPNCGFQWGVTTNDLDQEFPMRDLTG